MYQETSPQLSKFISVCLPWNLFGIVPRVTVRPVNCTEYILQRNVEKGVDSVQYNPRVRRLFVYEVKSRHDRDNVIALC